MSTCGRDEIKARGLLVAASLWLTLVLGSAPLAAQDPESETATIGPVSADQTLWSLARDSRPDRSASIHQFMLALVARNPDAFAAGNVNMLREGSVLVIPTTAEALAVPAAEATRRVTEQMQWYADLSPGEVQALHNEQAGTPVPSFDEMRADPGEAPSERVSELETTPLAGPEPAPLEPEVEPSDSENARADAEPAVDPVSDQSAATAALDEAEAADGDPGMDRDIEDSTGEALATLEQDAADEASVEPAGGEPAEVADSDPQEAGADTAGIVDEEMPETLAESIASESLIEDDPESMRLDAEESVDEANPEVADEAPAPVEPMSGDDAVASVSDESGSDTGEFWPVLVVLGVFGVAVLMVIVMMRSRPAETQALDPQDSIEQAPDEQPASDDLVAHRAEAPGADDLAGGAGAAPIAPAPVEPSEPEPAGAEPREESAWAALEATVLSNETVEPDSESKSKSQSISKSKSSAEADSGSEGDSKDDVDSGFDRDFEAEPEPDSAAEFDGGLDVESEPDSQSKSESPSSSKSSVESDSGSEDDLKDGFDSVSDFDFDFDFEDAPETESTAEFDGERDAEPEPDSQSKSKSQSISKSSAEAEPGSEGDSKDDFDSDFDSDFEAAPEPEETAGLSDADAEVMIDLARLTAQSGDRGYAIQLLDEVISDATPELAEQARDAKDSLTN